MSEIIQVSRVFTVGERQSGLSIGEDIEFVDVESAQISTLVGDLFVDFVVILQNDSVAEIGGVPCMLPDQRKVRATIHAMYGPEVENVPVVKHVRTGPDQDSITVVDVGTYLVWLISVGGIFGLHLAIGGNEPVTGTCSVAIHVLDIIFEGSNIGELN